MMVMMMMIIVIMIMIIKMMMGVLVVGKVNIVVFLGVAAALIACSDRQ